MRLTIIYKTFTLISMHTWHVIMLVVNHSIKRSHTKLSILNQNEMGTTTSTVANRLWTVTFQVFYQKLRRENQRIQLQCLITWQVEATYLFCHYKSLINCLSQPKTWNKRMADKLSYHLFSKVQTKLTKLQVVLGTVVVEAISDNVYSNQILLLPSIKIWTILFL